MLEEKILALESHSQEVEQEEITTQEEQPEQ